MLAAQCALPEKTLSTLFVRARKVQVLRLGGHQEVQTRDELLQSWDGDDSAQHFFGRVVDLLT